MKISIDKSAGVSGVITIELVRADYEEKVKDSLKSFCKRAQLPGFRPGKLPMGMAKRMYGSQAKLEIVNKMLSDSLFGYIRDEKINILGEPLGNAEQELQDIEKQEDFVFRFDVALAPEVNVVLDGKDKVDYYEIEVDDKMIDEQVKMAQRQGGHSENAETYAEGDILRGILAELNDEGQPKEGGIVVEKASLMPQYFKQENQKKIFAKAKVNDVLKFVPAKAYKGNDTEIASLLRIKKEDVANYKGEFSFQVEEISRFVPAELNQEFFDRMYGQGTVKSVEEMREKIKGQIKEQYAADADYKFLIDVRALAEKKAGEIALAEDLLKRLMVQNNKDHDEKQVEEHFADSIRALKWQIIRDSIAKAEDIHVVDEDLKKQASAAARFQFAQYGINNIPEEYLQNYAEQMLKDEKQVAGLVERAIDEKLISALKAKLKLNKKSISAEDFAKLFE